MKHSLVRAFVCIVASFLPLSMQSPAAETNKAVTAVLCRASASGQVVTRAKCRTGETRVNPQNNRFDGCYWRLGTPVSLAGVTSQVTISQSCTANDVLVTHSAFHNEFNNGIVSISSVAFISPVGASHPLPQGVTVRFNVVSTSGIQPPIPNGESINAEVDVLCCPFK